MKPTDEQSAIRQSKAKTLLVSASAGTGKTSTLVLYAEARPNTSMTYLAFNRPVKEEAQRKFPKNVRCVTTHGLAYPSHGRQYQAKLGNPKAYQIAQALGLQQKDAGLVLNVVTNFLTSAEREIGETHTIGESIPEYQRGRYIELANKAWAMMCDTENMVVSMPHDGYLKLFQLSNPTIRTDIILFDEAQDANPVTLAIVAAQTCGKVFVGDSRQSIYGFRGAVNAMDMIKSDEHLRLTTSFRYGDGVARLANTVLAAYDPHPHPIQGKGKHATCYAVDRSKPHTVLSRTNALLFGEAVTALHRGVPFAFVGGVANYKFDTILDTYHLYANRRELIKDKMIQSFAAYTDMVAYGKELDDKEVNSLIKIVEEYGHDIPGLVDRICREAVASPTGEEILMTTAHKAKGLEWMDVVLTDDFTDMKAEKDNAGRLIPPEREEINLLYVAMTRALRGIAVHPSLMEWMAESNKSLHDAIKADQRRARNGTPEKPFRVAAIQTSRDNRSLLESFGVKVAEYDEATGMFLAQIPQAAMAKLREFPADFTVHLRDEEEPGMGGLAKQAESVLERPDTSKPLFDNDGYEHQFVTGNGVEIVTKIGSVYAIWNAKTGECLKAGSEDARLGNTPLSPDELLRRKQEGARVLAELHANAKGGQGTTQDAVEPYLV